MTLKIGDTIWRFNSNHRVYPQTSYAPSRAHMWRPVKITDETVRSWITAYGKAPKKGYVEGWALSKQDVEDDLWVDRNWYRIRDAAEAFGRDRRISPTQRRKFMQMIADIIGFTPEEVHAND